MTPRMHQAGAEDSVSAELFQMCSAFLDPLGLLLLKVIIGSDVLQKDSDFHRKSPEVTKRGGNRSQSKALQLC